MCKSNIIQNNFIHKSEVSSHLSRVTQPVRPWPPASEHGTAAAAPFGLLDGHFRTGGKPGCAAPFGRDVDPAAPGRPVAHDRGKVPAIGHFEAQKGAVVARPLLAA